MYCLCSQDEKKKEYCANVAAKLDTFQKSLGDKKFFAGDKVHFIFHSCVMCIV